MWKKLSLFTIIFLYIFYLPFNLSLAEEQKIQEKIYRAEVTEITNEYFESVYDENEILVQEITAISISKENKGVVFEITNDTFPLKVGDKFYVLETYDEFSDVTYRYVNQIDRSSILFLLLIIFIATVIIFSGKQGVKSLLGLLGSFLVIMYILLPGLMRFGSPILFSIIVSMIILFFAVIITHGWNRTSFISLVGLSTTMIITALLAYFSVELGQLNGYVSEEAVYVNFNSGGFIDVKGILLGGIIIGVIGVLDDIAITQVSIVKQLWYSNPHQNRREVFKRAITVGKDHTSSLVNTLVLAYTGVGLPTLLLYRGLDISFLYAINTEQLAAEIVRTLAGSIGIILCVPITTYLAILFINKDHLDINDVGHTCAHYH